MRLASLLLFAFLLAGGFRLAPAKASLPPQCEIQRTAYCLWGIDQKVVMKPADARGTLVFELSSGGFRDHRIVEPWSCRGRAADTIPALPKPSDIRRAGDGWLQFTMRLRKDGSCDLQVSQQVPPRERGSPDDRLMAIPIFICLGEARAADLGHDSIYPIEWTKQGTACSLKY